MKMIVVMSDKRKGDVKVLAHQVPDDRVVDQVKSLWDQNIRAFFLTQEQDHTQWKDHPVDGKEPCPCCYIELAARGMA